MLAALGASIAPRCIRDGGADDGYYGIEGNHPAERKRRGGVMLRQRALLERTSSAGNEPNRANFGTRADVGDFNASTSRRGLLAVPTK